MNLRIAARSLAKTPGFTAVAVLTLALAIGANTAIFSLVDAALIRALPYRDPGALVHVWDEDSLSGRHESSWLDYVDYTKQATAFESLGGYATGMRSVLREDAEDEVVKTGRATASFFPTLGIAPAAGRFFTPEEDTGGERAAVLSHELFTRRFAGDRSVVGRTIVVDGVPLRVVGVLPAGFHFAPYGGADVWVSVRPSKGSLARRHFYNLKVIGRMKPGVTLASASADLKTVAARLAQTYPDSNGTVTLSVEPLKRMLLGAAPTVLLALFGSVTIVLVVACANIAGLLLVRGESKKRELAVRVALGAGRKHLLLQALGEGLVLAAAGGAGGLLLSRLTVGLLVAGIPADQRDAMPYLADVALRPDVLLFTIGLSLASGLLFASVPALLASKVSLTDALKGSSARGRLLGAREAFVVFQITLALALLTGAGLLVRSTRALLSVDAGFETSHLLSAEIAFPKRLSGDERVALHDRILGAARALPGVRSASSVDILPLDGGGSTSRIAAEGRPPDPPGHEPEVDVRTASVTYFSDLGMRVAAGRAFSDADRASAPLVVVVNQSLARRMFGNGNAVGRRLRFTFEATQPWREVVGVVTDARIATLAEAPRPAIYTPVAQAAPSDTNVLVRTSGAPESFTPVLRHALREVDPDLLVSQTKSLDRVIASAPSTFLRSYPARVVGVFSGLALFLAVLGIYGVTSFAVARRTREIGVRVAVGARPKDIVALVLEGGARLAVIGTASGLLASFLVGRALVKLLFGVSAADAGTRVVSVVCVLVSALLASLVPALRALRVEPTVALRTE